MKIGIDWQLSLKANMIVLVFARRSFSTGANLSLLVDQLKLAWLLSLTILQNMVMISESFWSSVECFWYSCNAVLALSAAMWDNPTLWWPEIWEDRWVKQAETSTSATWNLRWWPTVRCLQWMDKTWATTKPTTWPTCLLNSEQF